MRRILPIVFLALAGCASTDEDGPVYRQEGNMMIVTLTDGSTIRLECQSTSTRNASRISNQADDCELTPVQRQYVAEQQQLIDRRNAREQAEQEE